MSSFHKLDAKRAQTTRNVSGIPSKRGYQEVVVIIKSLGFLPIVSFAVATALGGCKNSSKELPKPVPAAKGIVLGGQGQIRLVSDVTVEGFYRLRRDPKIEYIFVNLHMVGCEPCKAIKTPEYLTAVENFNENHPDIRLVSMDVSDKNDPEMVRFKNTFLMDYVEYTEVGKPPQKKYGVFPPRRLFVRNRDGRYFKRGNVITSDKLKLGAEVIDLKKFNDAGLSVMPLNLPK